MDINILKTLNNKEYDVVCMLMLHNKATQLQDLYTNLLYFDSLEYLYDILDKIDILEKITFFCQDKKFSIKLNAKIKAWRHYWDFPNDMNNFINDIFRYPSIKSLKWLYYTEQLTYQKYKLIIHENDKMILAHKIQFYPYIGHKITGYINMKISYSNFIKLLYKLSF